MIISAETDNLIGCIGFETSESSIVSKGIRLRTNSKISHVFIVIGKIGDHYLVLEADEKDVDINFMAKYHTPDHMYELYRPRRSPQVIDKALEIMVNEYALVPYSYEQIGGFLLSPIFSLFGGGEKNKFSKGIICSELGLYYTEALAYKSSFSDPNLVSPEDLRKWTVGNLGFDLVAVTRFDSTELERVV